MTNFVFTVLNPSALMLSTGLAAFLPALRMTIAEPLYRRRLFVTFSSFPLWSPLDTAMISAPSLMVNVFNGMTGN